MAITGNTLYPGWELALFSLATNWKRYIKAQIDNYLIGDVLEVGAGIGATTATLHDGRARRWFCLEPDASHVSKLRALVAQHADFAQPSVIVGSLCALAERPSFDCVVYVDVLEHIHDDRSQIDKSSQLVRPGGYIIILAPAHQWLFSEFDKNIGHLRRYDKIRLDSMRPTGWIEKKLWFLDSVGILLCLGNALVLRRAMPSRLQIYIWDRLCIPISRILDCLLFGKVGKSVVVVWQKQESE